MAGHNRVILLTFTKATPIKKKFNPAPLSGATVAQWIHLL